MPQALSAPTAPATQSSAAVTFEAAASLCPNKAVAARIARVFSPDGPVDYEAIRRATRDGLASGAETLAGHPAGGSRTTLEQHLQHVVPGFLRSAHDAGELYAGRVARALTAHTDAHATQGGDAAAYVVGQAEHAAKAGLQAYALLAAAHGAVDAYARVCGEEYRPLADRGGDGAREADAFDSN